MYIYQSTQDVDVINLGLYHCSCLAVCIPSAECADSAAIRRGGMRVTRAGGGQQLELDI